MTNSDRILKIVVSGMDKKTFFFTEQDSQEKEVLTTILKTVLAGKRNSIHHDFETRVACWS